MPVYNLQWPHYMGWTIENVLNLIVRKIWESPMKVGLFYPSIRCTNNEFIFNFIFIMKHLIPAYIIDGTLFILGKKPL